jgi:hypothetical protein
METTSDDRLVKLADVFDNFCDARSESERRKFVVKARRANVCTFDAPQLQPAVALLRALIGS